jgi:hypothetical protein
MREPFRKKPLLYSKELRELLREDPTSTWNQMPDSDLWFESSHADNSSKAQYTNIHAKKEHNTS